MCIKKCKNGNFKLRVFSFSIIPMQNVGKRKIYEDINYNKNTEQN